MNVYENGTNLFEPQIQEDRQGTENRYRAFLCLYAFVVAKKINGELSAFCTAKRNHQNSPGRLR